MPQYSWILNVKIEQKIRKKILFWYIGAVETIYIYEMEIDQYVYWCQTIVVYFPLCMYVQHHKSIIVHEYMALNINRLLIKKNDIDEDKYQLLK